MQVNKRLLMVIILLGGLAVIGSYVFGILAYPDDADALWGGVPEAMLPFYTANMLLAASGYFAFTYYIFFRLDPARTRVFRFFGFGFFNVIYASILFPSALWMPFTLLAVIQSSTIWVWAVRLALWIVGLGSLALLFAIWKKDPGQSLWAHRLAVIGSIFFCVQTVVLDGIVWTSYFRIS